MGTKEKLLALLEENRGTYFSGEAIAEALGVSRTAVWKAVNGLRSDGYCISAVQNKGYALPEEADVLTALGVQENLAPAWAGLRLQVAPTVTSTNAVVRQQAAAGAEEGYTLLANCQTAGRGRLGRNFFSPAGTGLYLSLLLRPRTGEQVAGLTTMAAVAACEAIEAVSGEAAGIKWVNDIFVRGRKACGILTEASFSLENGLPDYAVLGVGINVYPPAGGFPPELAEIAGFVFPEPQTGGKNRLAAAFLNRFMDSYAQPGDYARRYRSRSLAIGKPVQVLFPSGPKPAVALDVDEDCHLVVQYPDGTVQRLSSGEISVRLAERK